MDANYQYAGFVRFAIESFTPCLNWYINEYFIPKLSMMKEKGETISDYVDPKIAPCKLKWSKPVPIISSK